MPAVPQSTCVRSSVNSSWKGSCCYSLEQTLTVETSPGAGPGPSIHSPAWCRTSWQVQHTVGQDCTTRVNHTVRHWAITMVTGLSCLHTGELLSPATLEGMDEGAAVEEAAVAVDSDETLSQPTPVPLGEPLDEALAPDIIAGTSATPSVFQSALVGLTMSFAQTQHALVYV